MAMGSNAGAFVYYMSEDFRTAERILSKLSLYANYFGSYCPLWCRQRKLACENILRLLDSEDPADLLVRSKIGRLSNVVSIFLWIERKELEHSEIVENFLAALGYTYSIIDTRSNMGQFFTNCLAERPPSQLENLPILNGKISEPLPSLRRTLAEV